MKQRSRSLGALLLLSLGAILVSCGNPGPFTVVVESKEKCMLSMTKDGKLLFENLPFSESYTGPMLNVVGVESVSLEVECLDGTKWSQSFDRAAEMASRTVIFRAGGATDLVDR